MMIIRSEYEKSDCNETKVVVGRRWAGIKQDVYFGTDDKRHLDDIG